MYTDYSVSSPHRVIIMDPAIAIKWQAHIDPENIPHYRAVEIH